MHPEFEQLLKELGVDTTPEFDTLRYLQFVVAITEYLGQNYAALLPSAGVDALATLNMKSRRYLDEVFGQPIIIDNLTNPEQLDYVAFEEEADAAYREKDMRRRMGL